MTGEDLWGIFLGANVPDAELVALGEDIGHKREVALAPGQRALLKICAHAAGLNDGKILFKPSEAYQALKMWMPGGGNPLTVKDVRKRLLEAIGAEYEVKRPWQHVSGAVREYFTQVGSQLPTMVTLPPAPPAPPASPPSPPSPPTGPAITKNGASATMSGDTTMGAESLGQDGSPAGLTPSQYTWLQGTIKRLARSPRSVSDNHLAAARNYAARGNLTSTLGYLEQQIEIRGEGAQTEDASTRAAAGGSKKIDKPVWPFFLGFAGIIAWMSHLSRKGQRLIHERVSRERIARGLPVH